jgi:hypothetical protein
VNLIAQHQQEADLPKRVGRFVQSLKAALSNSHVAVT